MLATINDRREIAFEFAKDPDSNWLRAYLLDEARVAFDRAGLCYLDADDCRELAAWLLAAWLLARAEEMVHQPPVPPANPKKRKKAGFHLDKHVEIGKHD